MESLNEAHEGKTNKAGIASNKTTRLERSAPCRWLVKSRKSPPWQRAHTQPLQRPRHRHATERVDVLGRRRRRPSWHTRRDDDQVDDDDNREKGLPSEMIIFSYRVYREKQTDFIRGIGKISIDDAACQQQNKKCLLFLLLISQHLLLSYSSRIKRKRRK